MRRLLLFLLCTIVPAFQVQVAAAILVSDVPVPGGTEAVARALGINSAPDRGRFISELTRLVLGIPGRPFVPIRVVAERLKRIAPTPAGSQELVPVPLDAALWSDAVFRRHVAPSDLVVAILSDARAALVCHGLSSLDDETLDYLANHPALLTALYERDATAFGAFADSLHIRGGRVTPPGGDGAIPLWEAIVGAKVTDVDRFVTLLLAQAEGRTAYLYDTIGQLDSGRAAFAVGLWIEDPTARLEAIKALTQAWAAALRDWRLKVQPFARQTDDPPSMLMRLRVDENGAPAPPASRRFWARAFESADVPDDPAALLTSTVQDRPVDAAVLIDAAGAGDVRRRTDRLDQVAFAQRVFGSASAFDMPDVLVAVRTFPRYRMLMLTLERLGVTSPSVYASAARQAARLSRLDGRRAFAATAQFQGALAILDRMMKVGTIDRVLTEALVRGVIAVPLDEDGRYVGAIARWLRDELRPAMPDDDTIEGALLSALSGVHPGATVPAVRWKGVPYRLDLAGVERQRLARVREKQGGASLDLALDLADAARGVSKSTSAAGLSAAAGRLQMLASDLPARSSRARGPGDDTDWYPPGVVAPPNARDMLARALDQLNKMAAANDLRRLPRVARQVEDVADEVAAQTLVSLVYAANIGDPDGAALLVGDVSPRHDFGFGAKDADARLRAAWMLPRQDIAPGLPWHVDGSLLGLEVALAPLELRRLNPDRAVAPAVTSNARETFAASVALLNAFALDEGARDLIVAAIDNGRHRVRALRDSSNVEPIANEINMDRARRRSLAWTLAHEPDRLESNFSLEELLRLGDEGHAIDVNPWGMAAIASSGCVCTEMAPSGRWRLLTGRPQVGVLATTIADLNLHVAAMLKELGVPSGLTKYVLGAAMQDFIDDARPIDPDDWLALVRAAQSVPRARIEEYVASATINGPLVLDEGALTSRTDQ